MAILLTVITVNSCLEITFVPWQFEAEAKVEQARSSKYFQVLSFWMSLPVQTFVIMVLHDYSLSLAITIISTSLTRIMLFSRGLPLHVFRSQFFPVMFSSLFFLFICPNASTILNHGIEEDE